ncbi:MAG: hypothetical protein AAFN08_13250 [Cyanobacteria bacterium J06559_3]
MNIWRHCKNLPGEEERLKFAESDRKAVDIDELGTESIRADILIQQLRHQIALGSTSLDEGQSLNVMEQEASLASTVAPEGRLIEKLGWTREETAEVRHRLASF